MIFDHVIFIFWFLPVFLILYYLAPDKLKNLVLVLGSLFFYAWGSHIYVLVLLASIVINYGLGKFIYGQLDSDSGNAGILLILGVVLNVAALGALKYYPSLECPIGISFYTLMEISYLFDVAYGRILPESSILNYTMIVSMFPMMPAGPVVTYRYLIRQLKTRKVSLVSLGDGVMWFIRGFAKAVILGKCAGTVYTGLLQSRSVLGAWLASAAFAFQIYFALSGYSDMATGLGAMLGFHIPENFRYPLASRSVMDFSRRWFMTVTEWMHEYVSNTADKKKKGLSYLGGQLLVCILLGAWYSNGVNTVAWGVYMAVLLILERKVYGRVLHKLPGIIGRIYFWIVTLPGWAIFAGDGIGASLKMVKRMLFIGASGFSDNWAVYYLLTNLVLWIVMILGATPIIHRIYEKIFGNKQQTVIHVAGSVIYMFLLILCIAFAVTGTADYSLMAGVFSL